MGFVKVLGSSTAQENIIAAAGRISTQEGVATEIYNISEEAGTEKNLNLIKKVLSSGHVTVLEHLYFNLAFEDVSVFVEQFLINFRLASFTIKSRRYVNFANAGYVIPDFEDKKELYDLYIDYMEKRFDFYGTMIDGGVPKEDARFVLPYCFHSNILMSVNASELLHIMDEMKNGEGRGFKELEELFYMLQEQLVERFPFMKVELRSKDRFDDYRLLTRLKSASDKSMVGHEISNELISLNTKMPAKIFVDDVINGYLLKHGITLDNPVYLLTLDERMLVLKNVFSERRNKELEAAYFSITFKQLSLAGITHLTRHRMHSPIVTDFVVAANYSHYIVPESILNTEFEQEYRDLFEKAPEEIAHMEYLGLSKGEKSYTLMAGLLFPVKTNMNARELDHFFKLRCCSRAQWEIKACADELLEKISEYSPELGMYYGPSCFRLDYCPEGRMCCGKFEEMKKEYAITLEK